VGDKEVIAAVELRQEFGGVVALDGVSFSLRGPQLIGILGPNGAGKTTLLDILEGLTPPSRGEFRLFGATPQPYPRRRVGVVMQREFLLEHASAGEYAELFAAIYQVGGGAGRILRQARLEDRAGVPMSRLSGGEAARLFIATATVHSPDILFLDEPTAHLDPATRREVGAFLCDLARECTVVLTTHDLREADEICDYLLFLVGGRVRAAGARQELVAAVPSAERKSFGVEDAFFHFCSARIRGGDIEPIE
jgi:ABC-2 type transport system ATP-binding protein